MPNLKTGRSRKAWIMTILGLAIMTATIAVIGSFADAFLGIFIVYVTVVYFVTLVLTVTLLVIASSLNERRVMWLSALFSFPMFLFVYSFSGNAMDNTLLSVEGWGWLLLGALKLSIVPFPAFILAACLVEVHGYIFRGSRRSADRPGGSGKTVRDIAALIASSPKFIDRHQWRIRAQT